MLHLTGFTVIRRRKSLFLVFVVASLGRPT